MNGVRFLQEDVLEKVKGREECDGKSIFGGR